MLTNLLHGMRRNPYRQITSATLVVCALLIIPAMAPAQCVQSATGETAVGLKNASSHFLIFYLDEMKMGGVPSGDRSVDFIVKPGVHLLRADATVGTEIISASRMATIPEGYVCTWTVTDAQKTDRSVHALNIARPQTRSDLLKQQLTAVINLVVPN